jgi:cyclic pyranopterin phosphate synthase
MSPKNTSDRNAKAGMVDVSHKPATERTATAAAKVLLNAEAFQVLTQTSSKKGNVFETSRTAGIMAAKSTASLIPLCHPIRISKISVTYDLDAASHSVTILSEVKGTDRTGVEMEAMTAVSVAALTVYDMLKYIHKGIVIADVRLLSKSGGKGGDYHRAKE